MVEQLNRDVLWAAYARRTKINCRTRLLRELDNLLQRLRFKARVSDQYQNRVTDFSDWPKVFKRVKRDIGKDVRINDHRAVEPKQQSVAVGLSRSHLRRTDIARSARFVFDDDLLVEFFRHVLCNQTRARVGDAPGREGYDKTN